MKKFIFGILVCVLQINSSFGQSEAVTFMEDGLKAHEALFEFITSHPCELGVERSCEKPLSARDLTQFKNIFRELEEWRKIAFDGIIPMAELNVDKTSEVVIGQHFSIQEDSDRIKVVINPSDQESREFIQKSRRATATLMLLYDSFFRLSDILAKARKLSMILEQDMPKEGSVLQNTFDLALNEKLWNRTTHSVHFLAKLNAFDELGKLSQEEKLFEQYLNKSFVFQKMLANDLDFRVKKVLFLTGQIGAGRFFEKIYVFMGIVSKIFGNTAGLFQSRDGKLKALTKDPTAMKAIKSNLRPLSIMLEKTPFRLTDHFIPGYFGHVAIWLGTPGELQKFTVNYKGKNIPLLSHPDVIPHLEKLSLGKLVLEALRIPGVTVNTLENFMDIDDLAIMDPPAMSEEETASHLLRAFQQIGKPYDFNFNVESEKEIVCSELIYTVFTNEVWPTEMSVGRFTISPDHVAWKSVDSCYKPVVLYLSGKKITSNQNAELRRVLSLPGGIDYTSSGSCIGMNSLSRFDHPPKQK
jgi:hypothetical protein